MSDQLIRRDLEADLVVRAPAEDSDERIIEGLVVPWDQVTTVRSRGEYLTEGTVYRESIAPGAAVGLDPERVTVESQQHQGNLVGRGLTAEDRPEGLFMSLKVARTAAGDELLELAREKVLRGMSVVFAPVREHVRADGVVERTAIDIRRVAVLERGAYPDAQVSAVRSEPEPDPPPVIERKSPVEYVSRDEKAARVADLEETIKRQAEAYTGVMPGDVQAAYDANKTERQTLLNDIAAWDARQADLVAIAQRDGNVDRSYSPPTIVRRPEDIYDMDAIRNSTRSGDEYDAKIRDYAMRSIDSVVVQGPSNLHALANIVDYKDEGEDGKGEVARRILLTGSPAYRRAFTKYLRGEQALWTPEEAHRAAIAVTGTTTTGGYAVPYIFDPTLIHIGVHTAINPYRTACRVETITNGNNWIAVTVAAITAAYAAEAAAATEQAPAFGQPTFTVQRAHAFATVSMEAMQDRPDLGAELTRVFGEAKDTLEENQFTVGVGTTVFPQGMFLSGAFTVVSTATNDTTVIADTLLPEAGLPLRHRANAAWFMSRSTQRQLEALDTGGYYFKRLGQSYALESTPLGSGNFPTGNTGTQLLGYPIWEVPSGPSTLTTDAAVIAVFGDPKNYVIVDRLGLSVEVIPHMLNGATPSFPTGQRGVYCYWRNTARALNADGMRQLDVN